jgi:hypothetical protein
MIFWKENYWKLEFYIKKLKKISLQKKIEMKFLFYFKSIKYLHTQIHNTYSFKNGLRFYQQF